MSFIKPGDEFGKCPRCGAKFVPEWVECLGVFSRFCGTCSIRNLADAFGLPEMYEQLGIAPDEHSKLTPPEEESEEEPT